MNKQTYIKSIDKNFDDENFKIKIDTEYFLNGNVRSITYWGIIKTGHCIGYSSNYSTILKRVRKYLKERQ